MSKLSLAPLLLPSVYRLIHPRHLSQAISLHRNRKKERRVVDDAQLQLYAQILPREYLHFGYFEDPSIAPEDMSLNCLLDAQQRYAEQLIGLVTDRERPVLDIGCGMGVVSAMLESRGFHPVALTPDRYQIAHIKAKYARIPSLHMKFEDIDAQEHKGRYGTLLNSESLQYLKLDRALPLINQLLAPGGRWVICDYFFRTASSKRSPHVLPDFLARVQSSGLAVTFQRDITAHVLPTLRFVHMWAAKFGLPLLEFGTMKLKKKQPAVHHMVEPSLGKFRTFVDEQLKIIDPSVFQERYQYTLLTIERA
jgi:cyclopropane fatty-acyl-phospholipid synthase-like methyltransferase